MSAPKVYLFTTCLVDQVFPQVGAAVVKLLRRTGAELIYPEGQVCCGQPFYNSGFADEARRMAEHTINILADTDAVVIPSGSCTAMIRHEYPKLFADRPELLSKAEELAEKTFEFTEYLARIPDFIPVQPEGSRGDVTYHDSCHMLRGLGVRQQPRQLLIAAGYQIHEMEESERCCGFGGVFYARMPEISQAMAEKKLQRAATTDVETVVTADPGCLMRMQQEHGSPVRIRHIAELLEEVIR